MILAACLVKKDNKYLLVQEATDKIRGGINTHSKDKWTFPHGEVDPGENIQAAAERELAEEAGGKTHILRLGTISQAFLNNSIFLLSFVFYGEDFTEIGGQWQQEIKSIKWFTKDEIIDLEKQSLNRDNVPFSQVISAVERNSGVDFIEWVQPDYVQKIFGKLEN